MAGPFYCCLIASVKALVCKFYLPIGDLLCLDTLEKCFEIALAKNVITLSLDEFKEDWADHRSGEDLQ